MRISIKRVKLWRKVAENRPGVLAELLDSLAEVGADPELVMASSHMDGVDLASISISPLSGMKAAGAAQSAGLRATRAMSALLVSGENQDYICRRFVQTVADAHINIGFVVALATGKHVSAVFGFDSESDARMAASLLKKLNNEKRPGRAKRAAVHEPDKAEIC